MSSPIRWFLISICLAVACVAGTFNRQPAGLIKGARLSYVSGTTIKVGAGYGENAGEYWEITANDAYNTTGYVLTDLSTSPNGFVEYIYIDKADSLFPAVTLTNSSTAPTWSDSYLGWYNGDNRCLGAVWITPSGTVNSFTCVSDTTYCCQGTVMPLVTNGASTTSFNWGPAYWHSVSAAALLPVNSSRVRVSGVLGFSGSGFNWCRFRFAPIEAPWACWIEAGGSAVALCDQWVDLPRNFSGTFVWISQSSVAATETTFTVIGYSIER